MLGSGNDGPAIVDDDAPRMSDAVDPATPYDASVIPDDVDPVTPVADAPMTPGADAPMIPDAGAPAIPGDTAPRSGGHLGILSRIEITQFSSSETRNRSLLLCEMNTRGRGVCPRCSLGVVLSNASSTRRLDLILPGS